ncbi:APC family permease [Sulfobacillus sp. hq2]|uniref:APC family permease n=1 Tax=Sulfobacillus TaxID=28033 RepID=UPI001FA8E376|nr:APC family permease [Sulfobacillus sp. hq2]
MINLERGLKRELSFLDLTMSSLGAIIGSGWLFAAFTAAYLAGPSSIFSWIIGGVIVLFIGLVYAELGSMIPESGGIARYTQYSHGHLTSFIVGWAAVIAYASVPAVEAEATVQYMSHFFPGLYVKSTLTTSGLIFAALLIVAFFTVNYFGIKVFARINTPLTIWKFLMPTLTVIVLAIVGLHGVNFSHIGGFMPMKSSGMLGAVASAGIVFSYLGFRQAVDLAGEAKNPQRDVPRALIVSIVIGIILYTLLQVVFIGALPTSVLGKGWAAIASNAQIAGAPFAQLAIFAGLSWLSTLLFIDAFLSPAGTGSIYLASTTRVLDALGRNGYLPKGLAKINPKTGIPSIALVVAAIISLIFLAPFPAWQSLVAIVSGATVFTYMVGPISAAVFRRTMPNVPRPIRLGGLSWIAPVAFIGASLIIYWDGWVADEKLLGIILIGVALYLIISAIVPQTIAKPSAQSFKSSVWMVFYLLFMLAMSYYGSGVFGAPANHGKGFIPYPWDLVVIAVVSLLFYYWGVSSGYRSKAADEVLEALEETRETGAL